jgi:hypothetical protein
MDMGQVLLPLHAPRPPKHTSYCSQVRELEAEVATTKDSLAKSTKRLLEDAAVDRAQLLTTTNMMDQTYQSVGDGQPTRG